MKRALVLILARILWNLLPMPYKNEELVVVIYKTNDDKFEAFKTKRGRFA